MNYENKKTKLGQHVLKTINRRASIGGYKQFKEYKWDENKVDIILFDWPIKRQREDLFGIFLSDLNRDYHQDINVNICIEITAKDKTKVK